MCKKTPIVQRVFPAIVAIIITGCTFQLDKKYVSPLQPPSNSIVVSVDIDSPDFKDPYPLAFVTQFSFRVGADRPITRIEVLVDNVAVATDGTSPIVFTLNPASYYDGTHTVKINIFVNSQSGSLVNHLGGEIYEAQKQFTFVVSRQLPSIAPPTAAIESDYMTLRWVGPAAGGFNYQILVYKVAQGSETFIRSKTLTLPKEFVYVDSGYVGGHNKYVLRMSNFAGDGYAGEAEIQRSAAHFTVQVDPNNASKLTWTPNFQNANFTLIGATGERTIPLETGTIDCDTLFLGDRKSYHLFVQRHGYASQAYDSIFEIRTAGNIPAFYDFKVVPQQSKLILTTYFSLLRINLLNFAREDSLSKYVNMPSPPALFSTSADGSLGAFGSGSVGLFLINNLDFSNQKVFLPIRVDPVTGNWTQVLINNVSPISNNGFAGISFTANGSLRAGIVDLSVDTNVSPLAALSWADSANSNLPSLSADGQYFTVISSDQSVGQVYKNNSGTWGLIGKITPEPAYFRGGSSTELISIGSSVKIYDVSSGTDGNGFFQPVRTFAYQNLVGGSQIAKVGYDAPSDKIYVETLDPGNYSTITTYDVVNFIRQATAKAFVPPSIPFTTKHYYSAGYHFLSSGFSAKVN